MKGLLRRIRGVVGTALTWALGWAGLFTLAGVIVTGGFVPGLFFTGGFLGLVGGGAFALILSVTERRHTLADLSLWRTALWGGVGGALVAVSLNLLAGSGGLIGTFVASVALFGAVSSAGTVAVAKRAEARLTPGWDTSTAGIEEGDQQPPALEGDAKQTP